MTEPKLLDPADLDLLDKRRVAFNGAVSKQVVDDLVYTARELWEQLDAYFQESEDD